jgi:hypothetical protein
MLGKEVILPLELSPEKTFPFVGVGRRLGTFLGPTSSESTEPAYLAVVMGVLPPDSKEFVEEVPFPFVSWYSP